MASGHSGASCTSRHYIENEGGREGGRKRAREGEREREGERVERVERESEGE